MDLADYQVNKPENSNKPYKITKLIYKEEDSFTVVNLNKNDSVVKIEQHTPKGRGDKFYCDIIYESKQVKRVFNIESIEYEPIKVEEEIPPWER